MIDAILRPAIGAGGFLAGNWAMGKVADTMNKSGPPSQAQAIGIPAAVAVITHFGRTRGPQVLRGISAGAQIAATVSLIGTAMASLRK